MQKDAEHFVTTGKIENSAVTADKLATDSVIEAKIENEMQSLQTRLLIVLTTNQKIGTSAVTADKIHKSSCHSSKDG